MDTAILAIALVSFFILIGSWLALPASVGTEAVAHGAPARA